MVDAGFSPFDAQTHVRAVADDDVDLHQVFGPKLKQIVDRVPVPAEAAQFESRAAWYAAEFDGPATASSTLPELLGGEMAHAGEGYAGAAISLEATHVD